MENQSNKKRKKPVTPNSHVKNWVRKLWLYSRERRECIRLADHRCRKCNRRESKAKGREFKIEVHHKAGVGNWARVMAVIREELLCAPDQMEVLCPECHKGEHEQTEIESL